MKEIYEDGAYEQRNPTWHEEDAPWKAGHIARILRRNGVSPKSICEVGCGTGEILLDLEKQFPEAALAGYEVSPQAFERAIKKQTPRTSFHLKDLLTEPDARFDVVLIIDVIEHVEDYIGFIKKVRMVGDKKVFHIPLDLSVQSIFRLWPIMGLRRNVGHIHYFMKESALAALRDCGYTILDHCYTASRLELPNQAWSSHLMRFPRRALSSINQDFAVRLLGGYSLLVLAE